MEKDLSFILLITGSLILVILFIFSLRTRVKPEKHKSNLNNDDVLFEEDEFDVLTHPVSASEPETNDVYKQKVEAYAESDEKNIQSKLIALKILPQDDKTFDGMRLLQTLNSMHMHHGAMSIFHRHQSESGEGVVLFSIAQAKEPGTFNLSDMSQNQYSGLTIFMQLNLPQHNLQAFQLLILTVQEIADNLGGIIVDQYHNAFSAETKRQFKAQIDEHLSAFGHLQ